MAVMNVNPTRMELTNLKRKLVTARRGHKLLKDKRDELMRQFLELVRENKRLRQKVEAAISSANKHFSLATASMNEESLAVSLMMPSQRMNIDVREKNIMSVKTPVFVPEYKFADKGEVYSYGLAFTSGDLDDGVRALS
ncbi:MAG: V-type ATP synthase subunit D, partial [Clostridia bacterium]|nr:V-type ATP synthase subunit D [Clostridia bacterium]